MNGAFERYAVYWMPVAGDSLARFGAHWTGWCAERGEFRPRFESASLGFDPGGITPQIRRHGFHGIIRAPFALRPGASIFALEQALETFAEESVRLQLPALRLGVVGGRVSLVPRDPSRAAAELISGVAQATARLTGGDAVPVSPKSSGHGARSDRVVQLPAADLHRFHAPLTDPLPVGVAFDVAERLCPLLDPILAEPRLLDSIALVGDPGGDRPFRLLQRYELRLHPARRATRVLPCRGPHFLEREIEQAMPERERVV